MRTDTKVDGKEVVCLWMKFAEKHLNATSTSFNMAVRKSGIGKTQRKVHLLDGESKDKCILPGINNTRQSCTAVFLDSLPRDLARG